MLRRSAASEAKPSSLLLREFENRGDKSKDYLSLTDLLKFNTEEAGFPLSFDHLGVLWVLDSDHDGRVTLPELTGFLALCRAEVKGVHHFEQAAHLRGLCALRLWQSARKVPSGSKRFAAWLCALATESTGHRFFWRHGTHKYVGVEGVFALHHILGVAGSTGLGRQAFLDLLQRVGEERRMLELRDEEQDDWVPLEVVREFGLALLDSVRPLLDDICPPLETA